MNRSICVLTPIADKVCPEYMLSVFSLYNACLARGIKFDWQYVKGNSNLQQARNMLMAMFLATDHSHALLVDSDVGFEAADAIRLLESPHDVIGGAIRKRNFAGEDEQDAWGVGFDHEPHVSPSGLLTVQALGTAFLMVSRKCLAEIVSKRSDLFRPSPKFMQKSAHGYYYRFFAFDDPATGSEGEDIHFCNLWKSLGGKIWLDPTIRLQHIGPGSYTGDISKCVKAIGYERETA